MGLHRGPDLVEDERSLRRRGERDAGEDADDDDGVRFILSCALNEPGSPALSPTGACFNDGGKAFKRRQSSEPTATRASSAQPLARTPCRRVTPSGHGSKAVGTTTTRKRPAPSSWASTKATSPPNVPRAAFGQPVNCSAGQPSNCSGGAELVDATQHPSCSASPPRRPGQTSHQGRELERHRHSTAPAAGTAAPIVEAGTGAGAVARSDVSASCNAATCAVSSASSA